MLNTLLLQGKSIRFKIFTGAFVVQLMLLALSTNMLMRLSAVNDDVNVVVHDIQPALMHTRELAENIMASSSAMGVYLLTGEAQERINFEESLTKIEKSTSALKDLSRISNNTKNRALLETIGAQLVQYTNYRERMITLGTDTDVNMVVKAYAADNINSLLMQTAQLHMSENIQALITSLEASSETAANNVSEVYATEKFNFFVLMPFMIALITLLSWGINRSISKPINKSIEVANVIAGGRTTEIKVEHEHTELGKLLLALSKMQDNLQKHLRSEKEMADNYRIKQALDSVSANVMLAGPDGTIIYLNEALLDVMNKAQDDIRKALPGFSANKLLDTKVKALHESLAKLNDTNDTYIDDIVLGDCCLRITVNPIISADGKQLGTVIEWLDRTQEIAIEEEIKTIVNASLAGDLSQRIDLSDKAGFFVMLSQGINNLVDVSERIINETVSVLGQMALGNLTQVIKAEYSGTFGQLKSDVNSTIDKLTVVLDGINENATAVLTGSHEISDGNANLSKRTEQQAASLEETAASMEEMTATVRQNADNAREANQLAAGAREQAEKGGAVVHNAVSAMSEISNSSKKIADIIGVIDEIAFQTNLLALNAAVEAARAGEQGRGFAVVASEVRNLAGRSATAAKEIKDLIKDSVVKVDEGSKLVDESGQTLEVIMNSVKKVSDIVAEIAAASQEQSDGIEQVNTAITQMDEMTQQNAALVEEAAAASETMSKQATNLSNLVAFFTINASTRRKPAPEPRPVDQPQKTAPKLVKMAASQQTAATDNSEWEKF